MATHTPSPQSAGKIREQFFQKIGLEAQHSSNSSNAAPEPLRNGVFAGPPPISTLGEVVPFKEPLKVCLDDDSSFEEDDEFDDDFFFGDDEDFEAMAIDVCGYAGRAAKESTSSEGPGFNSITSIANRDKNQQLSNGCATSLPPMVMVSDEGSSQASSSEASSLVDMVSMASSSSLRHSTGNLTFLSQDSNKSSHSKRSKSKRRVSLDNDVNVIPIPMRSEYCDQAKGRLWSSSTELSQNAARNSIEFAAEGWNWRTVTEDENMLVCNNSGELIHPIHLQNALQMNALAVEGRETLPGMEKAVSLSVCKPEKL